MASWLQQDIVPHRSSRNARDRDVSPTPDHHRPDKQSPAATSGQTDRLGTPIRRGSAVPVPQQRARKSSAIA